MYWLTDTVVLTKLSGMNGWIIVYQDMRLELGSFGPVQTSSISPDVLDAFR